MKRTPLKRKTPLRAYTPLKVRKGLNKISSKQRERNTIWKAITDQKARDLNYICQWCGLSGKRDNSFNALTGHHIIKRRYRIDTYENCYVCHKLCHGIIEDYNIDVRLRENKPRNCLCGFHHQE